jgi:hypothetical protein
MVSGVVASSLSSVLVFRRGEVVRVVRSSPGGLTGVIRVVSGLLDGGTKGRLVVAVVGGTVGVGEVGGTVKAGEGWLVGEVGGGAGGAGGGGGSSKSVGGTPANASLMNAFQVSAGIDPPVTRLTPLMPNSDVGSSRFPIQIAVDSVGV